MFNPNAFLNSYKQFMSQVSKETQNPNQIIQNLMNSGQVSQAQFNQARTIANQLNRFLK